MIAEQAKIECGLLLWNERVPESMGLGFRAVDPAWCWIAKEDGRISAVLLGAPCHGMAFIVRVVTKEASATTLALLLRRFLEDVKDRGYAGYFTFVDSLRETETRLLSICKKAGAVEAAGYCIAVGGSVEKAARW